MADSFMARCGDDCEKCGHRESDGCTGCQVAGKPFWGECKIAACCVAKEHDHCGQCADFPCDKLNEYASEPNNEYILLNLKAWNEMGYEAWQKKNKQA